jgi:excisionase family DNA binding protein
MSDEEWLTTFQAAEICGYHPNYVRKLLRDGEILGRKWGLSWQVNRFSLEKYLERVSKLGERRGPKKLTK